jgi:16S rRNA (guanine527-N7)-methyltransferase
LLKSGLELLEFQVGPDRLESLLKLARLLERWASRMNLTGHRTQEAIVQGLILEAAALLQVLPASASLADLGSGAGFPGLPIALLEPGCAVTLVESRERRHHFQRAAIRDLDIGNAIALRGRVEELEPRPHAVVVAQALARPERALPGMIRWAERGGLLVIPGGSSPPDLPELPDVHFETCLRYRVPGRGSERTAWLGRRD